ncbi:MAG: DUF4097 family beta strand repeat protein [Clostridia bacterium]|nr:DUF4097 family beta strand repeat protein [Clostridia bacterium]
MTTAQKVIKYIATAFAVFLIIAIISLILSGSYALLSAFGLIHTNKNIITDDLKVISSEVNEVSTLKIDLACTNLDIKTGDSFKVETNNSKIAFEEKDGSVKIKEENRNWLNNNNSESNLIIYIPEDMIDIDETKIETGAGKINIENLSTQSLCLELGAGDVYLENVTATGDTKIDGGVGKTELKSCEINNLKANLGMGEFVFNGKLIGKSEIDSGVGAINIKLMDKKENYTIEVDKGLGNVTLDGQKLEMDRVYGTGKNYLDIDGGIGSIKIDFKEE